MSDITITVREDRPYVVDGDIGAIDDSRSRADPPYDVELCRYRHSQNQSFPDGAHTAIDFDRTPAASGAASRQARRTRAAGAGASAR